MVLSEAELLQTAGNISRRRLRLCLRRGWIVPVATPSGPRFDAADLARLQLIRDLRDELGVNDDGIAVVLSLIDQLHGVRYEFRALGRAVAEQPDAVRAAVRDAYLKLAAG